MKKEIDNHKDEQGMFAPQYYSKFKCLADRCRHSCCIDWEICIDRDTCKKYKQMEDILPTVEVCEDGPCFALREDGRCPHLNEKGLCNIILNHGEAYLSEICQNHPRFYNYIQGKRCEVGLGIVCEEACRLVLENEEPLALSKVGELDGDEPKDGEIDFDALPERDRIRAVIGGTGSFDEKVAALKRAFEIPVLYTLSEWFERFLALEILDGEWEELLRIVQSKMPTQKSEKNEHYGIYYERLLAYFVYRHVSIADSLLNLRARLGFAILSVEVIRSLFEAETEQDKAVGTAKAPAKLIDLARRYSAEIEYSEDNRDELIFAFESGML